MEQGERPSSLRCKGERCVLGVVKVPLLFNHSLESFAGTLQRLRLITRRTHSLVLSLGALPPLITELGPSCYKIYEMENHDSDSSDGYSCSSAFDSRKIVRQSFKWSCKTTVMLYSDRGMTQYLGTLKIKAKGKSVRRLEAQTTTNTRPDGVEETENTVAVNVRHKTKKVRVL